MTVIDVQLGSRSYPVVVGTGVRRQLAKFLPDGCRRIAVVSQVGIDVDLEVDVASTRIEIGTSEQNKNLETIEGLCSAFVKAGLTRGDCVVSLGGGLVSDVAGFAAAVYHRGVPVIHVPTTLLAQIDAAVGGKTGVNLAEGKNLVGAFWQPSAVLCDVEALDGLPSREYLSGLGEMAKYHFIGKQFGVDVDDMLSLDIETRIARCVQIKANAVAQDEREGSARANLNYGHTLAHALEISGGFDLRHGEAVAIGIHYAARLARRLGRIDSSRVDQHLEVLNAYQLGAQLPDGIDIEQLVALMARDKKAITGLTFVLDGHRGVEPLAVDSQVAAETLKEMADEQ